MADEEDYMSSSFLNVQEDVRPGLTHSRSVKRKHEIEKYKIKSNKLHKTKSRKELEEESRVIGLDRPISSDNKGFAMLQKMGYKPGMKLGPQSKSTSNAGLAEPIKVNLKADRGGLGREEAIRQKIVERENRKLEIKVFKEQETERLTNEFRERMRNKMFSRELMADLINCRRVCRYVDMQHNVCEPIREWFWDTDEDELEAEIKRKQNEAECLENEGEEVEHLEDEDEECKDDKIEPEEQLNFIIDYLKTKHFYCFWCKVGYDDMDDMNSNCPGPEKSDH